MEAWGVVDGTETLLGTMAVHLTGSVTPAIEHGSLSLNIEVETMSVDAVTEESDSVLAGENLELLVAMFGSSLGGDLLGDLQLELPDGLGTPVSVETDGSGWLMVETD